MLNVIGIGPGSLDYIIPKAVKLINHSEVLIGGKRALALFPNHPGEKLEITGELGKVITFIQNNPLKKIAVLVSGDPGFHSLLSLLIKTFPEKKINVVPGISSVQLAYARLSLPWQNAVLLSLHGKELNILKEYLNANDLALLTDPINSPSKIAAYWLQNGGVDCMAYLCKNLSYAEEEVRPIQMSKLAELKENTPCVMVIRNDKVAI